MRALPVEKLRQLHAQYCRDGAADVGAFSPNALRADLSRVLQDNLALAQELGEITIKPSFYLVRIFESPGEPSFSDADHALLPEVLQRINQELEQQEDVPYKSFKVEYLGSSEGGEGAEDILEIHFTWQARHWYWRPDDVSLDSIYELRFGFAALDLSTATAMLACHSPTERAVLKKALQRTYRIDLATISLVKPLLEQIGSIDQLRRAGYHRSRPDVNQTENVTYADQRLYEKFVVTSEEDSPNSSRKHSLYRILFPSGEEYSVGVTSDSGKLWIPSELPIDKVREYGINLLRRIEGRIQDIIEHGDISTMLATYDVQAMLLKRGIKPSLCKPVTDIAYALVGMLLRHESECEYHLPVRLVTQGVPELFEHPTVLVQDPDSGETTEWRNADGNAIRLTVAADGGDRVILRKFRTSQQIRLQDVPNAITGARPPADPQEELQGLRIKPTRDLHNALLEVVRAVSQDLPTLRDVRNLPFEISGNAIRLDTDRMGRARSPEDEDGITREEIRALIAAWGHPVYRNRDTQVDDVRAWLNQFEEPAERTLMFRLLKGLRFYSEREVHDKLRIVHDHAVRRLGYEPGQRIDHHILVSGYGKIAKSAAAYARKYIAENGMNAEYHSEHFDNIASHLSRAEDRTEAIVLIDDLIGSGGTSIEAISKLNATCGGILQERGIRVILASICGLESGRDAILALQRDVEFGYDVYICEPFTDEDRCFSPQAHIFDTDEERCEAMRIAEEYGRRLEKDSPFGYQDGQLLVVMYDNCPNNTLPIIRKWKIRNPAWEPLFERVGQRPNN